MSWQNAEIMVIAIDTAADELVAELTMPLAMVFQCRVAVGQHLDLPPGTVQSARGQYLSSTVLAVLRQHKPAGIPYLLGVIDFDLYLPPLNFVFGQADRRGGVAVISVARLREEIYGQPPNDELFRRRLLTEGVHELGHLMGLPHCDNEACVMYFSNTLADTDRKQADFCDICRRKLPV